MAVVCSRPLASDHNARRLETYSPSCKPVLENADARMAFRMGALSAPMIRRRSWSRTAVWKASVSSAADGAAEAVSGRSVQTTSSPSTVKSTTQCPLTLYAAFFIVSKSKMRVDKRTLGSACGGATTVVESSGSITTRKCAIGASCGSRANCGSRASYGSGANRDSGAKGGSAARNVRNSVRHASGASYGMSEPAILRLGRCARARTPP